MPSHTERERRKRRQEEERRAAARTPVQEKLGLPGIDPRTAGGRPVAFAGGPGGVPRGGGNIPVPAKQAPQLAATQAAGQARLEQQAAGQAAIPILEEAGAFEEPAIKEVSLAPEEKVGGGLAFVGPSVSAIQSALGSLIKDTQFAGEDIRTGAEAFAVPLEPETIREAALREIKQAAFDEGISQSEAIGTVIEAIPVVGTLANKFASGLTQTPSGNVESVLTE